MKISHTISIIGALISILSFTPSTSSAHDDAFRRGFGITSFQPADNGSRTLDCRYYTALDGTHMNSVIVSQRAYTRKPDAYIESSTIENQVKARALSNYIYSDYEWALTNGELLNKKDDRAGFTDIQFLGDSQIIADVTDAIQIQTSDGAAPRLLLNISVAIKTDKSENSKYVLDHSWGVKSIDVNSVPFYQPEVYNKTARSFPMYIPEDQVLASLTGEKLAKQMNPTLKNREQATSHGLIFGDSQTDASLTLNLYRECKATK